MAATWIPAAMATSSSSRWWCRSSRGSCRRHCKQRRLVGRWCWPCVKPCRAWPASSSSSSLQQQQVGWVGRPRCLGAPAAAGRAAAAGKPLHLGVHTPGPLQQAHHKQQQQQRVRSYPRVLSGASAPPPVKQPGTAPAPSPGGMLLRQQQSQQQQKRRGRVVLERTLRTQHSHRCPLGEPLVGG